MHEKGIIIGSHVYSIKDIFDNSFNPLHEETNIIEQLRNKEFPVLNDDIGVKMMEAIDEARNNLDSVGGLVETIILNTPKGKGSPFFDSVESRMAQFLFSIPAVKGIEFGEGFAMSKMTGSEANDTFSVIDGQIKTLTNNNGGINGGITNGMPIVF